MHGTFTPTIVRPEVNQQGMEHSPAHQQKIQLKITEHGPTHQKETQFPPQSVSPIRNLP